MHNIPVDGCRERKRRGREEEAQKKRKCANKLTDLKKKRRGEDAAMNQQPHQVIMFLYPAALSYGSIAKLVA